MPETITLTQDAREKVRGLGADSIITCQTTSAPDVYVHVITKDDTTELFAGDSTADARLTRIRLHLFRKNSGSAPFSATIAIADAPPASKAADHTLAVQLHVPQGLAAKVQAKSAAKSKRKSR